MLHRLRASSFYESSSPSLCRLSCLSTRVLRSLISRHLILPKDHPAVPGPVSALVLGQAVSGPRIPLVVPSHTRTADLPGVAQVEAAAVRIPVVNVVHTPDTLEGRTWVEAVLESVLGRGVSENLDAADVVGMGKCLDRSLDQGLARRGSHLVGSRKDSPVGV